MNRTVVGVLLAAALSMPAVAEPLHRLDGDRSFHSLNQRANSPDLQFLGHNADSHRFALQVHYFSYSRHEEWQRLKAAGLTDQQAVRFLLTNPPGTDLASQMLP